MKDSNLRISIVTAVFNGAEYLPSLIESLKNQTDKNFEWIIADGQSTDQTLTLLSDAANYLDITIDTREDFGIYDALNRAVKLASGEYYLVLGADDVLRPDAVYNYKNACTETKSDFVTAKIAVDSVVLDAKRACLSWLYAQSSYVSSHAVGVAIKRSLHDRFGYYSRRFPIAADQLFILKSINNGATVSRHSFIAGDFDGSGLSSTDKIGTLTEIFRIQVELGGSLIIQLGIFLLRILKNR